MWHQRETIPVVTDLRCIWKILAGKARISKEIRSEHPEQTNQALQNVSSKASKSYDRRSYMPKTTRYGDVGQLRHRLPSARRSTHVNRRRCWGT